MPYSHLTGAVLSGQNDEHDAAMLEKAVSVRDGDDLISTESVTGEGEGLEVQTVTISTEGGEEEEDPEGESGAEQGKGTEGEEGEEGQEESGDPELPDFQKVDPKDMTEAGDLMVQAKAGQDAVLAKAIEGGMDEALVAVMTQEVADGGKLSEASYAALEAAGMSKAFVDSFIAGQVAAGEKFANSIMDYCGGRANFEKLSAFIGAQHADMADAFNSAIERNDVTTIRALLDSGKSLMRQSYGTRPARSLTAAAKPVKSAPAAPAVEGFKSRAEMVKAMSDVRYQRDAAFRREVELKVFHSSF